MTGQQDQIQKVVRSATTTSAHAASVVSSTDDRQDMVPAHEQHAATSIQKSETAEAAKGIAAVPAGEKQTSSEENETPDRGMNGNMPSHAFHQQVKTESSLTAITPSGAVQSDTSRTAPAAEQVVQQVRDRLAAHETKPGSEQIVLRLSPEHLGELKVNLNMDGQRLKVEIVAENRMVRDSLMQHTEALKESLSRQNIKMESFEVTTGGNTSADSGRSSQGDWRELAQQRQNKSWMPEGGYRLAQQATPAMAAYKTKSEHTMVDLHF
jgi:flagellar hook-length control protein FliK